MPPAGFRNGVFNPVEPLAKEWEDARELSVESAPEKNAMFAEKWLQEMQDVCVDSTL